MMGVYILLLDVIIFRDYPTSHFKWKPHAFMFYMQNSLSEILFILTKIYLSITNRKQPWMLLKIKFPTTILQDFPHLGLIKSLNIIFMTKNITAVLLKIIIKSLPCKLRHLLLEKITKLN